MKPPLAGRTEMEILNGIAGLLEAAAALVIASTGSSRAARKQE